MNDHNQIGDTSNICKSCGAELNNKFCSYCGEKKFDPHHDLSLIKLAGNIIGILFNFDNKFLKTLKKLFVSPGSLKEDYIKGRWVLYMNPFELFFFASVIFYFLLPSTNAYYSEVAELNGKLKFENVMRYNTENKLIEKTVKYNATKEQVVNAVIRQAISSSKVFLFTILPVWALFLFALFHKSNPFYISHLIFSVHCFTFFMIAHMIYLYILSWFLHSIPIVYLMPLFLSFVIYLFFAIRKFYQVKIIASAAYCFIVCLSFLVLLEIYRESVTMMTLNVL